jgi:hypothetical protein
MKNQIELLHPNELKHSIDAVFVSGIALNLPISPGQFKGKTITNVLLLDSQKRDTNKLTQFSWTVNAQNDVIVTASFTNSSAPIKMGVVIFYKR